MNDFEPPIKGVEDLPRSIQPPRDLWPGVRRRIYWRRRLMLGGAGLAVAASLVFLFLRTPVIPTTVIHGHPQISRGGVVTNDASSARLALSIGTVEVGPGSDFRVVSIKPGEQRFELRQGGISVQVLAPPRVFVVETPSAVATDLGCAYVLEVDALGNGVLRVTAGQVELSTGGRLSIVPAGAVATIRYGSGPGVPRREDAAPAFVRAVDWLDFGTPSPATIDSILKYTRNDDALTLWHLLSRVSPELRGRVYDRLAHFVPPPDGVTRTGVLALDKGMLDLWWNYLPWTGYRKP